MKIEYYDGSDLGVDLNEFEEEILKTIIQNGDAFMGEIADNEKLKGDCESRSKNNVIIFYAVKEECIYAIYSLRDKGLIDINLAWGGLSSFMVLSGGGPLLNLPFAKDPKRVYKRDRWIPVIFTIAKKYKKLHVKYDEESRNIW